ncbi:MAG: hypothetical protein JNK45_21125 [Myxococcales bacterium]|nr:hypothetical protein [Myxococcales bacterium]
MAIARIADIPFERRDVLELLALEHDRLGVDADYAGFGWALADRVTLQAPDRPPVVVDAPVIVALHSADEQPTADDIELLFEVGEQSLLVPLSAFLPRVLAEVPGDRPLVLALCNPGMVELPAGPRPLYFALGDVTSWLDHGDAGPNLRLSARRWRYRGEP